MSGHATLKLKSNPHGAGSISAIACALLLIGAVPVMAGTKTTAPKAAPAVHPAGAAAAPTARPGAPATRPGAPAAPATRPGAPATRPGAPAPATRPTPGLPARPTIPGRTVGGPVAPATHPTPPVAKPPAIDKTGRVTPPVGSTSRTLPNGHKEISTPEGTKIQTNAAGKATSITKADGTTAHLNPTTGKVTSVRKVGPDGTVTSIHNSPTGVRHIETVRKDPYGHPVRVVSHGNVHYQERELTRRPGYRQRTYFVNGHTTVVVYHNTYYGGYAYPVYVAPYYYGPAYYGWYGNPWATPVPYAWGAYPGYGYYGAYFAPSPYYATPYAWMADYIIAQNLQAAYAAQQAAAADPGAQADAEPQAAPPAPIPDSVKTAYIEEVKAQIAAQQAAASGKAAPSAVPGALDPNNRMFQAFTDVEADNGGEACALTGGDFVSRDEDTPDANNTVAVTVSTIAKTSPSHCQANTHVRVAVDVLQDWYNSNLEIMQAGMEKLNSLQGKDGFPPAPEMAKVANPNGVGVPDDASALSTAVQEQQASATALQAEVQTGGGQ